jgi:hypothetical protein
MNEQDKSLEERSRALLRESVENLDMRVRSRLTQARHAALAAGPQRRANRLAWWAPAGVTAAALLGAVLWMGSPTPHGLPSADVQNGFEDLDMLASTETGDAIDMLQDDVDFYDFAEKAAETEPAA